MPRKRGGVEGGSDTNGRAKKQRKKRVGDYGVFVAHTRGLHCIPRNLTLRIGPSLFEIDQVVALLRGELEARASTPEFAATADDLAHLGADVLDVVLDGLRESSGIEGGEAGESGDSSRYQHRQQLKTGICLPTNLFALYLQAKAQGKSFEPPRSARLKNPVDEDREEPEGETSVPGITYEDELVKLRQTSLTQMNENSARVYTRGPTLLRVSNRTSIITL